MATIVWSQSPDGLLSEFEVHKDGSYALTRVTVHFPNRRHFEHFQKIVEQGNADFDLRSRVAQHGIDFELTPGFEVNESRCCVSLEGKLYPWNYDFLPRDGPWWSLIDPAIFYVGKLVDVSPRLRVTKGELEELVARGLVRLPVGSVIGEESDFLPLDKIVYSPKEDFMTVSHIRDGLYRLPRERLNEIRIPRKVDNLTIGPKDTVISRTTLRPHDLSFAIRLLQGQGVRHTRAFYVEPHSAHAQIIELMGNGSHPVPVSGVEGNFYRTEEIDVEPRIIVPSQSLSPEESRPKKNFRSSYVFVPSDAGLRRAMKVSPYDPRSLRKFDNLIRGGTRGRAYYFYTFPPQGIMHKLLSYASERHIGSLVFSVPPIDESSFSNKDYEDIRALANFGINVVWDSGHFGRLYFHRFAFMPPEKRHIFDRAYSSASIMAIFGSQFPLEDKNLSELVKIVSGFKEFTGGTGGYGTVVSGGGPGSMTQSLQAARLYGLYTGSISIVKRGEVQTAYKKVLAEGEVQAYDMVQVDFLFPFDMTEINKRQDTLLGIAKVYVVAEGGFGTFSELYEALVKKGFYFTDVPIFLLGDHSFFSPTQMQLEQMRLRGRIAKHVLGDVHHITSGDQFLPLMYKHYNFQNKHS